MIQNDRLGFWIGELSVRGRLVSYGFLKRVGDVGPDAGGKLLCLFFFSSRRFLFFSVCFLPFFLFYLE